MVLEAASSSHILNYTGSLEMVVSSLLLLTNGKKDLMIGTCLRMSLQITLRFLVYEERPKEFYVQAIASKSNEQLDTLIRRLEEKAENHVSLRIEKTLIEPIGATLSQLKRVLRDASAKRHGHVSTIAHILLGGSLSEPQTDTAALAIMKSEGWVTGRNENDPCSRDSLNPFVALCYNQYFSEEEKRQFQTAGLSDDGVIEKYYGYQRNAHADVSIVVPYSISSSPSFPFSVGDKVRFTVKGNAVVVRKAK